MKGKIAEVRQDVRSVRGSPKGARHERRRLDQRGVREAVRQFPRPEDESDDRQSGQESANQRVHRQGCEMEATPNDYRPFLLEC